MIDYFELSDNELQQLAVSGHRNAEDELAARYMKLVRACARPLFLAGGDSEDLIQEGTFGLVSAIRQFDPQQGVLFSTYAEHCIKSRLYSAIRSATRLKHFPLNKGLSFEDLSDDSDVQLFSVYPGVNDNPENLILAKESKEELYSAFSDCLSRFEQKVLDLFLEGLSYRDIGLQLNKDQKSIDNAVQRIRHKLARTLNSGEISTADRK